MELHKLLSNWTETVRNMRSIVDNTGGKALGDVKFGEYRDLEDKADMLAGKIANTTGEPFGPRMTPDLSRTERLEVRERFMHTNAGKWGVDLGGLALYTPAADPTQQGFRSLGEQLRSVVRAGIPGQAADPRLFNIRSASGMSEAVGADGGFLVQTQYSYDLLTAGMNTATVAPRCNQFPIGANANSLDLPIVKETSRVTGSRFGGVRLYWAAEADTLTASKPAFDKLHLEPRKLTGLVYVTDELMQDATVLENFVRQAFTAEFAFTVDDAIVNADGVGKPLGILNAGCLVTVAKETGQAANTIKAENIVKMYARLPATSIPNAAWLVNSDTLPQLYTLSIAVGTGGAPIFQPAGGLSGKPYNTLLGLPVLPIEHCATLGTVGDVILADCSQYLLSTKGNLRVDSSIHVRFIYDEMCLRFVWRVDGMPIWTAAKTPAKGANAQSPFIALATRS